MDYFLLLLAVVCFAAQFAFTKLYEGAVRQNTVTSLVMLTVTSLIGAALFWAVCFPVSEKKPVLLPR